MVTALPTWICAKSMLQIHSHGRCFYPFILPVWISADPKNPSSPQATCQGWPFCCCHQGGIRWKSAKLHFCNISLLSLLRGGPSLGWSTERLPQAATNTEIPGSTWHSLFSILNSSMFFSALEYQSGSGTTKLRTHRKVYKRFSHWCLILFPQVTRPTCSQQLS